MPKGQFEKGTSGNPGGRPKLDDVTREALNLAREAAPRFIGRLLELVDSTDERVALAASTALSDRVFGKPTQPLANDPENPLTAPQAPSVDALAKLSAVDRKRLRELLAKVTSQ